MTSSTATLWPAWEHEEQTSAADLKPVRFFQDFYTVKQNKSKKQIKAQNKSKKTEAKQSAKQIKKTEANQSAKQNKKKRSKSKRVVQECTEESLDTDSNVGYRMVQGCISTHGS